MSQYPDPNNDIIEHYYYEDTYYPSGVRIPLPDDTILASDQLLLTYESLSSLQDIKKGCISESLFANSIVINSDSFIKCVICHDEICFDIVRRLTICKHEFHIDCIDKWFTENKTCPVCRAEI
jgi:hypothetical protein